VIPNIGFIVAAYLVVWGGIVAYAISLARRRGQG
jgi:CcmD family protein